MRLYTFINFYLSHIQQGIQTAHLVHELFNKYNTNDPDDQQGQELDDWSRNHKTIYVCNAGADPQVQELLDIFASYNFPYAAFIEDEGLCHSRTGCGIVLPDWIYDVTRFSRDGIDGTIWLKNCGALSYYPGDKYHDLITLIKSKKLA